MRISLFIQNEQIEQYEYVPNAKCQVRKFSHNIHHCFAHRFPVNECIEFDSWFNLISRTKTFFSISFFNRLSIKPFVLQFFDLCLFYFFASCVCRRSSSHNIVLIWLTIIVFFYNIMINSNDLMRCNFPAHRNL